MRDFIKILTSNFFLLQSKYPRLQKVQCTYNSDYAQVVICDGRTDKSNKAVINLQIILKGLVYPENVRFCSDSNSNLMFLIVAYQLSQQAKWHLRFHL